MSVLHRSKRRLASAVAIGALGLTVAACGTGGYSQTASKEAAVNGAYANISLPTLETEGGAKIENGSIAIREAMIVWPKDGLDATAAAEKGEYELAFVIANDTDLFGAELTEVTMKDDPEAKVTFAEKDAPESTSTTTPTTGETTETTGATETEEATGSETGQAPAQSSSASAGVLPLLTEPRGRTLVGEPPLVVPDPDIPARYTATLSAPSLKDANRLHPGLTVDLVFHFRVVEKNRAGKWVDPANGEIKVDTGSVRVPVDTGGVDITAREVRDPALAEQDSHGEDAHGDEHAATGGDEHAADSTEATTTGEADGHEHTEGDGHEH